MPETRLGFRVPRRVKRRAMERLAELIDSESESVACGALRVLATCEAINVQAERLHNEQEIRRRLDALELEAGISPRIAYNGAADTSLTQTSD